MRLGAVVQARMASTRLPGKVLMPLAGRPALDYLIERLNRVDGLSQVVVATSDHTSDDAVAEHCAAHQIALHRGAHDDVASRLLDAAERFELDGFARVNGDSPLLDHALVARGADLFAGGGYDLVTNVFPRSFPRGQSIEVIRTASLRSALPRFAEPEDREHVTIALYRDPGELVIKNFSAGPSGVGADGGPVRLVLDTPEDAARIEALLQAMDRPHWQYDWEQLLDLARAQGAPA